MAISKAEQCYEILKSKIFDGTYSPGYRLVIDQLGREYGISSVPWRESLRRLEAEGWVDIIPNAGAVVKSFDTDSWMRTIRLLARLEGLATALSAPKLSEGDLGNARQLNVDMRDALERYDMTRFGRLNRRFHEVLCSRCEDERLSALVEAEWTRMDIIRRSAFWYAPGRAVASLEEHDELLTLIETSASEDRIEAVAREHEVNTMRAILRHDAELSFDHA